MSKRKIHSQPRIKGVKREASSTHLHPELFDTLNAIAFRYGVSRSWVEATILAKGLNFSKQVPYYQISKLRRVK